MEHTARDAASVRRDAQVRLWWDHTPVDMFFDVDAIHHDAAAHVRAVPFAGATIPVLDGNELAVFKMMYPRPKDWVDLAEMVRAGTLDVDVVAAASARIMGPDHESIDRLRQLEWDQRSRT